MLDPSHENQFTLAYNKKPFQFTSSEFLERFALATFGSN